jgi:hypothetical protein
MMEKQSYVSKGKLFYELPDWYRQLVNAFWQFNYKEEVWTESPIPVFSSLSSQILSA